MYLWVDLSESAYAGRLTSLYNRANGGISDLTLCSQQPLTLCLDHGECGERRRRKRIDDGLHLSPSTAWF